jgi:hypothetical protein
LSRIRPLFALCAVAVAVPLGVAGCGSDDSGSGDDPQTVLDETFNNDTTVTSGDLSLTASIDAGGEQGGSFDFTLGGPFQGITEDENAIPQLDWEVSATGEGAGQQIDFSGGLVVTTDNAFVEYNGEAYEVGTEQFTQIKDEFEAQAEAAAGEDTQGTIQEQCATAIEQAGGDPSACADFDPASWLTNETNDGNEDVAGTDTIHISADADVPTMLADIGNLAAAVPGADQQGFDPAQLDQVSGAVTEATIDVYTGAEDKVLRKLEVNLTIDPSAVVPEGVTVPVEDIQIAFAVEIAGLNEEQTIEAPADAKPIDELFGDVGIDPSSLGGLGGTVPGASEDGDAFQECMQQATTAEEINACAAELQG